MDCALVLKLSLPTHEHGIYLDLLEILLKYFISFIRILQFPHRDCVHIWLDLYLSMSFVSDTNVYRCVFASNSSSNYSLLAQEKAINLVYYDVSYNFDIINLLVPEDLSVLLDFLHRQLLSTNKTVISSFKCYIPSFPFITFALDRVSVWC